MAGRIGTLAGSIEQVRVRRVRATYKLLAFTGQRLARYRRSSGTTASRLTFACQRPKVHKRGAYKNLRFVLARWEAAGEACRIAVLAA